jgi:hypothetical protein
MSLDLNNFNFMLPMGRFEKNVNFVIDWLLFCCFYLKHAALRSKSKDWLERYEDNVSDWSDMSNHRLLFQWAIENPAKCVGTKWTSSHCNLFLPRYSWKIAELALNNNHTLVHSLLITCSMGFEKSTYFI